MSAPHLLSKSLDPLFALGVGLSAAALRIHREEKEKGRTSVSEILDVGKRRLGLVLGSGAIGGAMEGKAGAGRAGAGRAGAGAGDKAA